MSRNDSVPSELIGKWYKGSTSALGFLDRQTGISDAAGGEGFSYEFKSNGSFVKAGMVKAGSYGCSTVVFGYETGKFTVAGGNLKMVDKENYVSYKDSCSPQTNSGKNAKLATNEYPYEIRKTMTVTRFFVYRGAAAKSASEKPTHKLISV